GDGVAILAHVTVGRDVTLGARTVLHPGVVIGDGCTLGADTVLHPNVVLYRKTQLGSHVIVHAGAVIGADGFGYVLDEENHHGKIPQIGRVVIEDHVEIGANTCIDRATFGETVIRQGTKIDNLVQVAHNCTVGDHSILVSQSGLSGSCRLGRYNVLAGQVGLADHVTLADEVTLAARAGTFRDLPEAGVYGGAPAMPLQEYGRLIAVFLKLPDMAAQVRNLERRLQKIEKG
ncbi:MAG: UDP-3-O-(3-hydroxymyristoyl)glucosamine N-acyltransferase, partial [Nitrospinaceae bacterium]